MFSQPFSLRFDPLGRHHGPGLLFLFPVAFSLTHTPDQSGAVLAADWPRNLPFPAVGTYYYAGGITSQNKGGTIIETGKLFNAR